MLTKELLILGLLFFIVLAITSAAILSTIGPVGAIVLGGAILYVHHNRKNRYGRTW